MKALFEVRHTDVLFWKIYKDTQWDHSLTIASSAFPRWAIVKDPPATPEPTTSDTFPVFSDYCHFVCMSLSEGKGQGLSSETTGVVAVGPGFDF